MTPIDVSGTERAVGKTENTPWDFGILKLENIFAVSRKPEKIRAVEMEGMPVQITTPRGPGIGIDAPQFYI